MRSHNAQNRGKKRLHGDDDTRRLTREALASMLSKKETIAFLCPTKFIHVGTQLAKDVMEGIGYEVGSQSILATCIGVAYHKNDTHQSTK